MNNKQKMARQELVNYLKQCKERKISFETAKKKLMEVGWSEKEIDEAWKEINKPIPIPSIPTPSPKKLSLKEKIKRFIDSPQKAFEAVEEEPLKKAFGYYALLSLIPSLLFFLMFMLFFLIPTPYFIKYILETGFKEALKGWWVIVLLWFVFVVLVYLSLIIYVWVFGFILHGFIKIFIKPNQGIKQTYKALMYGSTPSLLFGWILPFYVWIGIWSIVLHILGLKILHKTSLGKTIASYLLTLAILMIIGIILMGILFIILPLRARPA